MTNTNQQTSVFNVMSSEEVTVHVVKQPVLYALASASALLKEWPKTILHNGQRYYFVSSLALPELAVGNYTGYAHYELKNFVKHTPVTHQEFGAYLIVLGTAMRNGNNSLHDVQEPRDHSAKTAMIEYVATLAECDDKRALFIIDQCWMQLKGSTFESIPGPDRDD